LYNKWKKQRYKKRHPDRVLESAKKSNKKQWKKPTYRAKMLKRMAVNRNKPSNKAKAKVYQLEYMRKRREDELQRIKDACRSRVYQFLISKKCTKKWKTAQLLQCTASELRKHLGSTVGKHIDHIFPLNLLDSFDDSNMTRAMHFSNLQVLTTEENLNKSDKLPTKAMAAKVPTHLWPPGVTEDMLPDIYDGWATPLRM